MNDHTPDRAALRDRIADVIRRELDPVTSGPRIAPDTIADEVLAVLPPVSRADVLREAAEALLARCPHLGRADAFPHCPCPAVEELRRMADEEQPATETQAQPPRHRWAVETRDGVADEWAPGTRFLNRHHAVERYEALSKDHPTWRDGTPVQRRIVRETTTYTVEAPAVVAEQPAAAKPPVAYGDGYGSAYCLACHPHLPDLDVPLTADYVQPWELCPSCGRHITDVAKEQPAAADTDEEQHRG